MQQAFVRAYVTPGPTFGNGTLSAREAGYKGKPNTLAVRAVSLLTKDNVKAAIEAKRAEFASQTDKSRAICEKRLMDAINDPDTRLSDVNRSIEVLAKMMGWNSETVKLEASDRQRALDAAAADRARKAALLLYGQREQMPVLEGEVVESDDMDDAAQNTPDATEGPTNA